MRIFKTVLSIILSTMLYAGPSTGALASGEEPGKMEKATFAGGCFWCMEPPFDKLEGVKQTVVGYTGGQKPDPTYEQVAHGMTNHAEAIEVTYDPSVVSYEKILEVFWMNIDPTQKDGQFVDLGRQYRTAIFYHNDEQKALAFASKDKLEKSGKFQKPIVTEILPAGAFYRAEEYHQDYYQKSPVQYKMYRVGSGRDSYIHKKWSEKGKK